MYIDEPYCQYYNNALVWKKCLSNYYFLIFGIFIILLISVPESAWASSKSPYQSDYDYGCDDAGISESSEP
jgi:hypothetical protein